MRINGKDLVLDGEKDILIMSSKMDPKDAYLKPDIILGDESLEGLLLYVKFKNGSAFLQAEGSASGTQFVDHYRVPSAFYKL
jgi:hypothetical protein